jgi:hypothetical protein
MGRQRVEILDESCRFFQEAGMKREAVPQVLVI